MGNQFGKISGENSTSNTTNPQTQSNPDNSSLQVTPDLASYESECQLDPDLRSFDSTLQEWSHRVISNIADSSLETQRTSLPLVAIRDVTVFLLGINQESVKLILEYCKEEIWKNKELFNLVQDYFQNSILTLDFCNALDRCLKRARDQQLFLQVSLEKFAKEQRTTKCYAKTLEELDNFKSAEHPFTEEFFSMFRTIYNQQVSMLEKLKVKKKNLYGRLKSLKLWRKVSNVIFAASCAAALICTVVAVVITAPTVVMALAAAATVVPLGPVGSWLNSMWSRLEKELRGEWDAINSMYNGTFITIADFDNIRLLVDKLQVGIQSLVHNANLAVSEDHQEVVVLVMDEIKNKLRGFMKTIDELSVQADVFREDIMKANRRIVRHVSDA